MNCPRRILSLILLMPTVLRAQILEPRNLSDFPRSYVAAYASARVIIDGRMDDPAWERAP